MGRWIVVASVSVFLSACAGGSSAPGTGSRDAASEATPSGVSAADAAADAGGRSRDAAADGSASEAGKADAAATGDTTPGDVPICEESSLRCAGVASAEREICRRGRFEAYAACPEGQVCDARDSVPAGTCAPLEPVCEGAAASDVCRGDTLVRCTADGVAGREAPCPSANHCQQGLAASECAECIVGRHQCVGALLQRCNDAGQWGALETCDSAALCNAAAGACTDRVCVPDAYACAGDSLRRCDGAGGASFLVEECGAGLCDAAAGACDVCAAGAVDCADATTVRTCNAQGDGFDTEACPAATPRCAGSGNCLECVNDEDCPDDEVCAAGTCAECATAADCPAPPTPMSDECAFAACGGGQCRFTYSSANTPCGPNDSLLCSGGGLCGECNPWTPCAGTDVCFGASCVECYYDWHCGSGLTCTNNVCS